MVPVAEVTRLLAERRATASERPIVGGSARNRLPGVVTRIERDRVAAVVEIMAGPHRMVSLMTAEAIDDMGLQVGDEAVAVVKATAGASIVRSRGAKPRRLFLRSTFLWCRMKRESNLWHARSG